MLDLNLELAIHNLEKNLPEFLRAIDLIELGLFKSRSDVCWAIKRGQAPAMIRLSQSKIVFPKAALIQWLKEKAQGEMCLK